METHRRDAAPSGCTGSKLSETANLKVNTFASLGKSSTNVAPGVSPADAQASERLYQLAEIRLATVIQDDDTELEEAAAPYDQDFLLVRATTTGWKYYEEGERDVDVLVAAAVEAIEGDVTDHDMRVDLIQMTQEVFGQVGFPCPPPLSSEDRKS